MDDATDEERDSVYSFTGSDEEEDEGEIMDGKSEQELSNPCLLFIYRLLFPSNLLPRVNGMYVGYPSCLTLLLCPPL